MCGQPEFDNFNNALAVTTSACELSTTLSDVLDELNKSGWSGSDWNGLRRWSERLSNLKDALSALGSADLQESTTETLTALIITLFGCRLLLLHIQSGVLSQTSRDKAWLSRIHDALRSGWLARIINTLVSSLGLLTGSEGLRPLSRRSTASSLTDMEKLPKPLQASELLQKTVTQIQRDTECMLQGISIRVAVKRLLIKSTRSEYVNANQYIAHLCDSSSMRQPSRRSFSLPQKLRGRRRSRQIDQTISIWQSETENDCHGIGLWSSGSEKERILTQLEMSAPDNGTRRSQLRSTIRSFCIDCVYRFVKDLQKRELQGFEESSIVLQAWIANYLGSEEGSNSLYNTSFGSDFTQALTEIWTSPQYAQLVQDHDEPYVARNASYFFNNIDRLGSPSYNPTNEDITQFKLATGRGFVHTHFPIGPINVQLTTIGGGITGERKKWIHYFENPHFIMFVVNLAQYDETLIEDPAYNRLREGIILFDSIVNSRWFAGTTTILVLNNGDECCWKLAKSPLERHFQKYDGGADARAAVKFLVAEFMNTRRDNRQVRPILVSKDDASCVETIHAIIQQIMLERTARK